MPAVRRVSTSRPGLACTVSIRSCAHIVVTLRPCALLSHAPRLRSRCDLCLGLSCGEFLVKNGVVRARYCSGCVAVGTLYKSVIRGKVYSGSLNKPCAIQFYWTTVPYWTHARDRESACVWHTTQHRHLIYVIHTPPRHTPHTCATMPLTRSACASCHLHSPCLRAATSSR